MSKEINEDIFKQIDKEHSDDYKKHDELYRKAIENKYKEQDDAEERESDKLSHKDWAEKRFTNKNVKGSNKTRSRKIKKLRKDIDRTESAFESLENLNVSEECFDDICEDIFSAIKKKYPESKDVLKRVQLEKEARKNKREERNQAIEREPMKGDFKSKASAKVYMKREGRGKDSIYRSVFDQAKLNREQKRNELLNILKKGVEKTNRAVGRINKASNNLKESILEEVIDLLEEYISEVSDDLAKAANTETTKRYDAAKNTITALKSQIKNKDFYTKDEIKELKKDLKNKEADFEEAKRKRVRDNHNQLNRDVRLGRV